MPRATPPITVLVIGALLVACAVPETSPTATPDASSDSSPAGTEAPADTPAEVSMAPASLQPSPDDPLGGDATITGTLGADSVEGGCAYLETADGTRYEVMYPEGWELNSSPLELRSPDGEVVARGGDEVTLKGEIATDVGSTCQIGPIFRASAVEP